MNISQIEKTAKNFECELCMHTESEGSFSLHMVLYQESKEVTAHYFFDVKLSMLYGVRMR